MTGWTGLLDLVYPRLCALCEGPADGTGGHLCWDCRCRLVVVQAPFCERCGDPIEGRVDGAFTCSACRTREPAYVLARSVYRYRGGIGRALRAFKYSRAVWLRSELSSMLAAAVRVHYPAVAFDGVAYVPLHRARERLRSYNQARLLASGLGAELRLPVAAPGCVERIRETPTQTGLKAAHRRRNVEGAFRAEKHGWMEGRRMLLIDDVMTTGATVEECSAALMDAGCASVHVVTVARG